MVYFSTGKHLVFLWLLFFSIEGFSQEGINLFESKVLTVPSSFTIGVEGPAVDKNGNLYAVNFQRQGTIGIVTPNGNANVFIELPKGSIGNGIRISNQGDMYVADYTGHNILKIEMQSKKISVFAHDSLMIQPNDIAITKYNTFFASNPNWKDGTDSVWYANKKGKIVMRETNMGTTNGIEVSPDNNKLYVNESLQRKVWQYKINRKGKLKNKKLLIEFTDYGMDGMRCDVNGNLYIARYGKGTVAIVSPAGKFIKEVRLIGKNPTNIAFGGADGKTVYVTMQDRGNIEYFITDTAGNEWNQIQKQ